jgi:NAD-dependent SIR2 family protein deacetylase
MAATAHKTEEEKKEYFDPPDVLEAKVAQLTEWVRSSDHFIAFTGAGISTSAGIPDFRSGYNTVLPTGPGAWEKAAKKVVDPKKQVRKSMQSAIPTPTHMSFVKLMEEGYLRFLISQNVDGLHRKSGIPPEKLAELHGNTNLEICKKCNNEYMRDFRVRTAPKVHEHATGRRCDDERCKGELHDTIINFGENLVDRILNAGFENGARADLCLAIGSSLRVTPAADIPEETATRGGKLVVVNLQKTPLDRKAAMVIHAFCDTVMNMLMANLGLEIPAFKLVRRIRIKKTREGVKNSKSMKECLTLHGIDVDGKHFTLFPKIDVGIRGQDLVCLKKEPFKVYAETFSGPVRSVIHFQGHYSEPPFSLEFDSELIQMNNSITYKLTFDPERKVWEDAVLV